MPTDVPAIAQVWYDELAISQPGDEERGQPLMLLLGAAGVPFRQLHDLVRDTPDGPGWSALFDPDRCPDWALPWLAQAVGLDSRGQAPAALRDQIRGTPRFKRGTRDALIAAVQTQLTGDRVVRILERDTSPYHLTVVVRTAEAPLNDRPAANKVTNPELVAATGWDYGTTAGGAAVTSTAVTDADFGGHGRQFAFTTPPTGTGVTDLVRSNSANPGALAISTASATHVAFRARVKVTTAWASSAPFRLVGMFRNAGNSAGPDVAVAESPLNAADYPVGAIVDLVGVAAVPATNGAYARIAVQLDTAVGEAGAAVVGRIMIAPLTSLWTPDYGDGSVPGWAWDGTAFASSSTRTSGHAVRDAALTQKPAGLTLDVVVSDEPLIDEFTRTIDAITATIDNLTLADVT